ncbi:hypothetical protein BKA66DRAFT_569663 [Pyrenochaeta sp. MPI-SDFR-AT-0127]|nr:hypothetical protein BKA66DRAFT_569663 [Pyrenochaeta sp. MPI-SDFR-AT-0127]
MAHATAQTKWPAFSTSVEAKALIEKFFSLMDDPNEGVGDKLADELFTSDGILRAAAGAATGSSEIRKSREHAWNVIKKRRHSVQTVYSHDAECSDLMVIGVVEMDLTNGISVDASFTARFLFAGDPVS